MSIADYLPVPAKLLPFWLRPPTPRFHDEKGEPIFAMLAEFSETPVVYHAAEMVREAGYSKWDVHSPFPIHGIDEAMGHKRTKLPYIIGAAGLSAAALGFLMQWWISVVAYPMVVQGKPYGAWEPFVPITFEIGILGTAFTAILGMFAFNGLPRFHHPLYKNDRFLASSDDKFFVCIEASDEKFEPRRTRELLEKAGASHIEFVIDEN